MESAKALKTGESIKDERQQALVRWLNADGSLTDMTMTAMAGDASFRRYFRIQSGSCSFVAMDAPPVQENCHSYVVIARALRNMGLHTPEILKENIEQGFLLLTDFGDITYLKALNVKNADPLYRQALDALVVLQACREVPGRQIPLFTRELMQQEWEWHKEWFAKKLLGLDLVQEEPALNACYGLLVESAAAQPQVFMHRDYHSANLMLLPDHGVGILDFQDAFIGPVTYDLASLLRDCYIDWPPAQVVDWALYYWQALQRQGVLCDVSQEAFLRWFDLMSTQRHLKALLTFARKHVRDHQPQYLQHIPRTLNYLLEVTQRYPELTAVYDYVLTKAKPAFEQKVISCVP